MDSVFFIVFLAPSAVVLAQNLPSTCSLAEECVGIRSCGPVVEQLTFAKESSDPVKRSQIIREVRNKICGPIDERKICCDKIPPTWGNIESSFEVEAVTAEDSSTSNDDIREIGSFRNIFHNIGGKAFAVNSSNVLIKGFTYDGQGPDAFFLAGTSDRPSNKGDVVLPVPFTGEHFNYSSNKIPILGQYDGTKDVELTLPPGKSVEQLRWISVWCRDYSINFGHVNFPDAF